MREPSRERGRFPAPWTGTASVSGLIAVRKLTMADVIAVTNDVREADGRGVAIGSVVTEA